MIKTPIHRPVLLTIAATILSVAFSVGATHVAMIVCGLAEPPAVAYYLAAGLPATIAPLTIFPLLLIISRQRMLRAELERLVGTDMLTDVPNRRAFFDQAARMMERPIERDRPLTAMMIDIDHFKAVNDTNGHRAGDDILIRAATVIRNAVAEAGASDWAVARIGGDEFSVLVEGMAPSASARLAERICREARRAGDAASATTVSVGVAFRRTPMNIDDLLRRADEAVYEAKKAGRDRWVFADGTCGSQAANAQDTAPSLLRRLAAG